MAWATVFTYAGLLLSGIFESAFARDDFPDFHAPIPGTVDDIASAIFLTLLFVNVVLLVVAAGSLVVRLRRTHGEQRQQVKWVVTSVTIVVVVFATVLFAAGRADGVYLFGLMAPLLALDFSVIVVWLAMPETRPAEAAD